MFSNQQDFFYSCTNQMHIFLYYEKKNVNSHVFFDVCREGNIWKNQFPLTQIRQNKNYNLNANSLPYAETKFVKLSYIFEEICMYLQCSLLTEANIIYLYSHPSAVLRVYNVETFMPLKLPLYKVYMYIEGRFVHNLKLCGVHINYIYI